MQREERLERQMKRSPITVESWDFQRLETEMSLCSATVNCNWQEKDNDMSLKSSGCLPRSQRCPQYQLQSYVICREVAHLCCPGQKLCNRSINIQGKRRQQNIKPFTMTPLAEQPSTCQELSSQQKSVQRCHTVVIDKDTKSLNELDVHDYMEF